jgi:hypothetical protein
LHYDKAVDKGLVQNMKEDKMSFGNLRAKLQREAWPDCSKDQTWWQREGWHGGPIIMDGERFWTRDHPETAKPLAEYWFHVLKGKEVCVTN